MKKGSITVFFSIIFTVVLALVCTVLESARMYAAGVYAKSLTNMALESQFAGYARQVFDDYGILLLWEKESFKEELQKYIDVNYQMPDINTTSLGFDMLQLQLHSIDFSTVKYITDNGGDEFVRQILTYEKLEMAGNMAEQLISYYQTYCNKEVQKITDSDAVSDYEKINEGTETLQTKMKDFQESVVKIKEEKLQEDYEKFKKNIETIDTSSQGSQLTQKNLRRLIKYFKRLEKVLSSLHEEVQKALAISEEYEEISRQIVRKYGEKEANSVEKDDIKENRIVLKKMYEGIEKVNTELIPSGIEGMQVGNIKEKEVLKREYLEPLNGEMKKIIAQKNKLHERVVTEEQKKGKGIWKAAKNLLDTGILELVMPVDYEVSTAMIDKEGLPSNDCEEGKENPLNNLLNKAIFIQYTDNQFGNGVQAKKEDCLQYEMEYVIAGKESDKENLSDTVMQLVAMRQIFNTIYLFSDTEKMTMCTSAAAGAATAIGLPIITPVIKIILIQAWALAESIIDVRDLLKGESVSLIKQKKDWKTSLTNLAETLAETGTSKTLTDSKEKTESEQSGNQIFTYETYLKILLMTKSEQELIYRVMDLIQQNVNKKYNGAFQMNQCVTMAQVDIKYGTNSLFTSIGFVQKIMNTKEEGYKIQVNAQYKY